MSRFELKSQVFSLRKSGKSLLDISRKLKLSKSTVSLWCREIILRNDQREALKEKMISLGHRGRLLGAQINRQKKLDNQKNAKEWATDILGSLSLRDHLIAGIALYWAEGSKSPSTTGFVFVNSDPHMIKSMYEWLVNILKIAKEDIRLQVSINEIHRPRIKNVLKFWSDLLNLPESCFSKTFFAKSVQKKIYENHDNHYGVLRLGVRKSSILKYRVLYLIDILKSRGSSVG